MSYTRKDHGSSLRCAFAPWLGYAGLGCALASLLAASAVLAADPDLDTARSCLTGTWKTVRTNSHYGAAAPDASMSDICFASGVEFKPDGTIIMQCPADNLGEAPKQQSAHFQLHKGSLHPFDLVVRPDTSSHDVQFLLEFDHAPQTCGSDERIWLEMDAPVSDAHTTHFFVLSKQ